MRGNAYSQTFGNQFYTYLSSSNYFIKIQVSMVYQSTPAVIMTAIGKVITKIDVTAKQVIRLAEKRTPAKVVKLGGISHSLEIIIPVAHALFLLKDFFVDWINALALRVTIEAKMSQKVINAVVLLLLRET